MDNKSAMIVAGTSIGIFGLLMMVFASIYVGFIFVGIGALLIIIGKENGQKTKKKNRT